jgi:hypothetical protein
MSTGLYYSVNRSKTTFLPAVFPLDIEGLCATETFISLFILGTASTAVHWHLFTKCCTTPKKEMKNDC